MYIMFPYEWNWTDDGVPGSDGFNGPPPADPGTIYLCRDDDTPDDWYGPEAGRNASYVVERTSLDAIIDYMLESAGDDIPVVQRPPFMAIRSALLAAAAKIEVALLK